MSAHVVKQLNTYIQKEMPL